MPKVCKDCLNNVKNRSKKTVRCGPCSARYRALNAKGRKKSLCCSCNKEISQIKSKTNLCFSCFANVRVPWNKGLKGSIPWNKGVSIFESKEAYRIHNNKMRKKNREMKPLKEKIPDRIRTLIRNSLRYKAYRRKNGTRTEFYIGCSIQNYMDQLELKFLPGMTWENYGNGNKQWNIDHIIPISKFDLSNDESAKLAFHFSNCQPMWAIDNFKKGNRIPAATLSAVITF